MTGKVEAEEEHVERQSDWSVRMEKLLSDSLTLPVWGTRLYSRTGQASSVKLGWKHMALEMGSQASTLSSRFLPGLGTMGMRMNLSRSLSL